VSECYNKREKAVACYDQVQNCENFLKTAEAAFLAGRWHPNQGAWAKCGERRAGSLYGRPYTIQCSYLDSIDKDPEFQVIEEAARKAEAKRKIREVEWEAHKKEMAREGPARVAASLDETLSQAAASIPGSVADVRTAGVNPCVSVKRLLAEAELTIRRNPSFVGDRRAEYEAKVRTLEARCAAQWRRLRSDFVLQESKSLSKQTRARLRQYPPSKLTAQADICARVRALADESLADPDSDRELQRPLRATRDKAAECLTMCDDLADRAEQIYQEMVYLCRDHPEQKRILAEAIRRKNQVDRESGTRSLTLDRELAEQKIMLREERATAIRRLKQLGAPYSKAKCSTLE
jgi:hypothetical protein